MLFVPLEVFIQILRKIHLTVVIQILWIMDHLRSYRSIYKHCHVVVVGPIDFKFYTMTPEVVFLLSLHFGEDSRSKTGSSGSN